MNDESYRRLAEVLDTLPNGFPATEDGLEIRLLEKIFTPEEADLTCDLRLSFETAEQIAERTGRPLEGLEEMLTAMAKEKGEILCAELEGNRLFKLVPWAIGIYEFQIGRMDRELAEMCRQYYEAFGAQFFAQRPQLMRTIPVGQEVEAGQQALPYDQVAGIIEAGQSFGVNDCVCKKEERLLDNGCDHPSEVCLAIAPIPGQFEDGSWGRAISKQEAYAVLDKAEEAGLVHLTGNVESGHHYICNCCGCCCGVLKGITKLGLTGVVNSDFYSQIDAEVCSGCGLCADNVCQVGAIEELEDVCRVDRDRCIGCGLCVRICPTEALQLFRKRPEDRVPPPKDENQWFEERARLRGVDYSAYR